MADRYKPISHGVIPTLERLTRATRAVHEVNRSADLPFSFAITSQTSSFGYLFPQLQFGDALLPESPDMRGRLTRLGAAMMELSADRADSTIPSAYTYFGQFVDHDITFEAKSDDIVKLSDTEFRILTPEEIATKIENGRTPGLDLDNVYYKPAPRNCSRMVIGAVSPPVGGKVLKSNPMFDVPRRPRNPKDENDRAALIGDKRNDENLVISQLHVAFLRAHNAITAKRHTFDEARKILRRHYQWIVIKDYLPRICDPFIVNEIVVGGNKIFLTDPDALFMPFEFSVAAYRFGHSMVRNVYRYNENFPLASLADLFMLTAFAGNLRNRDTLPADWVIDWNNFLTGGSNRARPIDTGLSRSLFDLTLFGKPMPIEARLSVRNLLRGYMLRLPTGQAVASALNLPVLSAKEIEEIAARAGKEQLAAVREGGFSARTPLWFYILAEAANDASGRLGPVGSTIVAEVLIGLIRGSKDSILRKTNWKPSLGQTPGVFTLRDLLDLAGVL